jgi:thiamine-phosphate pyrophosphorylase
MKTAKREERLKRFSLIDLYPVTCEPLSAGRTNREALEGILFGGARIVQLRDKERKGKDLEEEARWFRKRTEEAGILLILNGTWNWRLRSARTACTSGGTTCRWPRPADSPRT